MTNEILFSKIEYFPSQVFLSRRKKYENFNIFQNYIIIVEVACQGNGFFFQICEVDWWSSTRGLCQIWREVKERNRKGWNCCIRHEYTPTSHLVYRGVGKFVEHDSQKCWGGQ